MAHKLFVYGTLMTGQTHYEMIAPYVQHVYPGKMNGLLYHCGQYPAMIDGKGLVIGEIMEVRDPIRVYYMLDQLEDYFGPDHPDNEYERVSDSAMTIEGKVEICNVYKYSPRRIPQLRSQFRLIPSGDWLESLGRHNSNPSA